MKVFLKLVGFIFRIYCKVEKEVNYKRIFIGIYILYIKNNIVMVKV